MLPLQLTGGSSSGRTADSDSANQGSNPCPPAKYTVGVVLADADYSAISSKVPWVRPASCSGVKQKTELGGPAAAQIVSKVFK